MTRIFYHAVNSRVCILLGAIVLVSVAMANARLQAIAAEVAPAAQAVIDFDRAGKKSEKELRIAYLSECTQNTYCQTRIKGMNDAAAKFGFTYKLYDPNFSPAEQLKQVQTAIAENFDGFIIGVIAAAPVCAMFRQYLVPTGKPIVAIGLLGENVGSGLCGDNDYTAGLSGYVGMQREEYYTAFVLDAFSRCQGECKVAAVGGFVGSDLFNLWEKAVKVGAAKYPNVKVVADQPGNYDPRAALRIVQDALRAHPDLKMVISPWDDETRGVEQAIASAGKKPGVDVKIYSIGGTKEGVARVKQGTYNTTDILTPYEEAYYGAVALVMAIEGKPVNGFIDEAMLPKVTDGPGSTILTKENVDRFEPNY